jgi:transglutaminase-like putative cysteine protease/tetratricopeptide (TPR) repeat protein
MDAYPYAQTPRGAALILRTAALGLILYQIRLLARDVVDTPIFAVTLVSAFAVPWLLFLRKVRGIQGILIIAALPWTVRLFIALPRIFFSDTSVMLDSLLLNLDRNSFISLLPFYWAGFTTSFAVRSRTFLHGDIILADGLLIGIFSAAPAGQIEWYSWPVVMILVWTVILLLQIGALILSAPPEFKIRKTEQAGALGILCVLIAGGGLLFLRPFQEKAVEHGGGLLAPNLFRFDFSQFVQLESEISMKDDLVFIVKKDPRNLNTLLRRYVLSGYDKKQGFFRHDPRDEKAHPQRLPQTKTGLPDRTPSRTYQTVEQEYYLVNFDASAFIGMNEPVQVTPFETWDASSFSSAYRVESRVSDALMYELADSMENPAPEDLGLNAEEYQFYTDFGKDERIAGLAAEITKDADDYHGKVELIYWHLKDGGYRYSLKPGIAADGDQLGHFLFQSKKGYCSYYAFSMALLLRSLGIPARVAAGFFIDPGRFSRDRANGAGADYFNYYPVRSNMAHAWVEVRYPDYGWIEYDPTTEQLAEGEDFQFSSGIPEEFERLMKEIMDNYSRRIPKEGAGEGDAEGAGSIGAEALQFIRSHWIVLFGPLPAVCFLVIRSRYFLFFVFSTHPRKKAARLWDHAKQRIALGGYPRGAGESEAEWAKRLDLPMPGVYALYHAGAAARYAPEYSAEPLAGLLDRYRSFSKAYAQAVPLGRRLLGWVAPPLALVLGPWRNPRAGKAAALGLFLVWALQGDPAEAQYAEEVPAAETLYYQALDFQRAERWDQAVELYARGAEQHPEDPRFSWALGELYYRRHLYGLAWDYYLKTEKLLPEDVDVLYKLSRTAAYLNRDAQGAGYLERLLSLEPDNETAIGNLGWMYFKLHRLGEGRELLLSSLERLGPNPDFSMTLGMIFTDLFQYEDAKKWYLDAIAQGEALGDRKFTAVSHYNLSLLETRFYQYDLAFARTNGSLNSQNRAPGRIARGELFLRRLEFPQAFSDYQAAYELDSAPLSKINLAQAYQLSGRLEEARRYAEACLEAADLSWMLNYGIDPVRYKRNVHEILSQVYAGLEQTEDTMLYDTWKDWVRGGVRKMFYWVKQESHRHLYRKYSLLSANLYKTDRSAGGESNLDALNQYYHAFEGYPKRALIYLRKAKAFETALIPESDPSYAFEEGKVLKNPGILYETLGRLDPVWERDIEAEIYTELAKITLKSRAKDAAERLYGLNRGGLRQQGIRLPVELRIHGSALTDSGSPRALERAIRRNLKAAGIDPLPGSRFLLSLTITGAGKAYQADWEMYDQTLHSVAAGQSVPLDSLSSPADLRTLIRAVADGVFINQ